MDTRAVIHKIIQASANNNGIFSSTGGPSWLGQSSGMQPQINQAIGEWTEKGNAEPLLGVIEILCTTGALTDKEADELRAAIE